MSALRSRINAKDEDRRTRDKRSEVITKATSLFDDAIAGRISGKRLVRMTFQNGVPQQIDEIIENYGER